MDVPIWVAILTGLLPAIAGSYVSYRVGMGKNDTTLQATALEAIDSITTSYEALLRRKDDEMQREMAKNSILSAANAEFLVKYEREKELREKAQTMCLDVEAENRALKARVKELENLGDTGDV